jgi:hypothetical protein
VDKLTKGQRVAYVGPDIKNRGHYTVSVTADDRWVTCEDNNGTRKLFAVNNVRPVKLSEDRVQWKCRANHPDGSEQECDLPKGHEGLHSQFSLKGSRHWADKPEADVVNHPTHYTSHPSGIECITITEHMSFTLGNAVKYIWRADLKGDAIEDLKKARFYIDREIAKREKK